MLPGGTLRTGRRVRDFAFHPATGSLEMRVAESVRAAGSAPARVTAALAAALERLGGAEASPAVVRQLCVGDRDWLVRQLLSHLNREPLWITASCPVCRSRFDVEVAPSRLPTKPAGHSFPFVKVRTSRGVLRFRAPNGTDLEALAEVEAEDEAVQLLLRRCLAEPGCRMRRFNAADRARIEEAIEEACPEVTTRLAARCAECDAPVEVHLDPSAGLEALDAERLLDEVATMAATFHWSEAEILRLPHARRAAYLDRIARQGLSFAADALPH